ncbi:OmpA family protein [Nitrosomonas sp. PY1]|uniref:OmpA/MotB family protein n=1 Tax=Nitrosomonas sp. PY1 TaxID=1803906 RepID=UPI001FC878DF|nr:OmpA family protein [Nitrosomonas sp. PY1]GKS69161.1 OmpA family protein [Nitrosomonas sp. PY1]
MRVVIIGLSIFFFLLSVVALYKGLTSSSDLPLSAPVSIDKVPIAQLPPKPEIEKTVADNSVKVIESDTIVKSLPIEQSTQAVIPVIEVATTKTEQSEETKQEKTVVKASDNNDSQYSVLAVFGGRTFRSGEDQVNDAANLKIEKLISELMLFPNNLISVEGHSDSLPTGKIHRNNMELSIRRARAIANLLIERGIARDRISISGYGDTRPIESNSTEDGRAKNRRVEVKLTLREQGEN